MESEAERSHRALVETWERVYRRLDDASFERRSDLIVALAPAFPLPQCNGPWVVEDSDAAVAELPRAIAEVEAAGAHPWVQTRSAHERTRQAALELGLSQVERVPAMAVRPGELAEPAADVEIVPVGPDETALAVDVLAVAFGAPRDPLERLAEALQGEESSWVVGRANGEIVSTAASVTVGGVTGVFNVATPAEHRGRGYGAALTAHVVRTAFDRGSDLAYLQSSVSGYGVYRGLGFRDVEQYALLTRPRELQKT